MANGTTRLSSAPLGVYSLALGTVVFLLIAIATEGMGVAIPAALLALMGGEG